jgi:hypothetical protein
MNYLKNYLDILKMIKFFILLIEKKIKMNQNILIMKKEKKMIIMEN